MMESSNSHNEQQNQHILGIASYGSLATIKETSSPICHISFYLKCCVGCGIVPSRTSRGNIVDPTITRILIDYEHADRLPGDWQRLLLDIVLNNELKVERLLNDVFYVDDEHITLPENASNSFFAIETGTAESILLQQYFLRYGLPQQSGTNNNNNNTHRIMFCTSQWLEEFYFNPIKELRRRAECINSTLSDPLLPASSDMFLLNQGGNFHCTHCRGVPGLCACECGCPTSSGRQTRCKALHRGIVCSSCNQNGIEGKLYICSICSPKTPGNHERFCERCYEDGVHDQTHSFYCFDHAPTTSVLPRLIPPRVQAEQTTQNQEEESCSPLDMLLQLYIPTAMAVPIQECNTCEAAVADAAAAAADTVVVSTSNSHDDDDYDDYDESMTLDEIFDDDDEITSTTSSSNHTTHHHRFSKGQMVRLVGFSANHTDMNGKEGIVLSVIDTDRCYGVVQVQIIAPYCQQEHLTVYTVRPENLIQVLSCGGNEVTERAPSSSSASCY